MEYKKQNVKLIEEEIRYYNQNETLDDPIKSR